MAEKFATFTVVPCRILWLGISRADLEAVPQSDPLYAAAQEELALRTKEGR